MEEVTLKGNREGVVVHLNCNAEFATLCAKIREKIKTVDKFLGSNTEVIVNCGTIALEEGQAQKLQELFQTLGLRIKKIIPEVKKKEGVHNMAVVPQDIVDFTRFMAEGPAMVIRKNLRSGQSLYHEGTLIILGDVNPGAEVIASGHILVIGNLRGIAHAGVKGDTQAIVFATRLQPTQLRIGNFITRAPDEEDTIPSEPEIARIKNNMVVIEKYLQK